MKHYSLGDLIEKLSGVPPLTPVRLVGPGLMGLVPCDLDSYRGYYDHLALSPDPSFPHIEARAGSLLACLEDAIGKEFQGYKGGWFRMSENTAMWVSVYGRTSGLAVVRCWLESDCVWILALPAEFQGGGYCVVETEE